jgi:hypothetical protein
MRRLITEALKADAGLTALVPAARIIQFGAVDEIPDRPFIVLQFSVTTVTDVKSGQPTLNVRVHDNRGSYIRIDDIIALVDEAIQGALPLESDTARIVCAEWTGVGEDLIDDGYNTNVRISNYTLTGRK